MQKEPQTDSAIEATDLGKFAFMVVVSEASGLTREVGKVPWVLEYLKLCPSKTCPPSILAGHLKL